MYNKKEVFDATLKYFNGDELAANVFFKYCLQDKDGNYHELTPDDMHKRLAKEFARIEAKYPNPMSEEEIYSYFKGFGKICAQGSPMFGIGNNYQDISLSNCFVIDSPSDNMSKIFDTGRALANLSKRRGGVGLDLSELRPNGASVNNSAKTSSGAWSFADFYSNIGRMVGQNGRRSAIMITLDIRHPDIESFIEMKHDLTKVTGANVSVRIRDDFMHAVVNNTDYTLQWPVESSQPKVKRTVQARDIWSKIVNSACTTAEPGVLYWDTMLNNLPAECYADVGFKHISTNPCSELILSGGDSCRLITQNLKTFVKNTFEENKAYFDFEEWKECVKVAMRLSDDLVDLELEKLSSLIEIADTQDEKQLFKQMYSSCYNGRRTGLGTHGLADALACLCQRYDSDEALNTVKQIYTCLRDVSYKTSVTLAEERGTFPVFNWNKEKDNLFIKRLPKDLQEQMAKVGRRNISLLTNAPTGSVAILSQTSSGLEPVFKNNYIRRKKKNHNELPEDTDFVDNIGDRWSEFAVYHHNVKDWYNKTGNGVDVAIPNYFVESGDIDWQKRVDLQAILTSMVDHSISSTINLPANTSPEIVGELYMEAWKKGCKGLTVYVDGSRSGVLVSKKSTKQFQYNDALKRPEVLKCDIHQVTVKNEKWTILVGLMDDKPYEIFAGKSIYVEIPKKYKSGEIVKKERSTIPNKYDLRFGDDGIIKDIGAIFENDVFQTAGRLTSALLRHGVNPSFICEQLSKDQNEALDGFHRVVSRVLKRYIKDGTKVAGDKHCGSCEQETLIYQDGCVMCSNPECGWSRCS